MLVSSELLVSISSPSFIALQLLVSELANILLEVIYCCFTRTILFTTLFTMIILVCSLKRTCIPRFILIGSCVRELHAHLSPYRNVWPEALFYKNYIV